MVGKKKNRMTGRGTGTVTNEYQTAVLLRYCNGQEASDESTFPAYFSRELEISNIPKLINGLVKNRFLAVRNGTYEITSKGQSFLDKKKEYLQFFDAAIPYLSIEDYKNAKKKCKDTPSFENCMLVALRRAERELKEKHQYPEMRNACQDLGDMLLESGRKKEALFQYLKTIYFDLSGDAFHNAFSDYMKDGSTLKDLKGEYYPIRISFDIKQRIQSVSEEYFPAMVDEIFKREKTIMNFLTADEVKKVVDQIIADELSGAESTKLSKLIDDRFNKMIDAVKLYHGQGERK